MNIHEKSKALLASTNRIDGYLSVLESKLTGLTGKRPEPEKSTVTEERLCSEGSIGGFLEYAFVTSLCTEDRLEGIIRFLEETVEEPKTGLNVKPNPTPYLPETVEAADLPRFLKKATPTADDFTTAVARDLGVEQR